MILTPKAHSLLGVMTISHKYVLLMKKKNNNNFSIYTISTVRTFISLLTNKAFL